MTIENEQLHSAIEEQVSSHYRHKLTSFLRQLSRILFQAVVIIVLHIFLVSSLIALFQQKWQQNSLPFWQQVWIHMFERNTIYLGIGLLLFSLVILDN